MASMLETARDFLSTEPWSHIVLVLCAIPAVYLGIYLGGLLRKLLFDD